MKVKTNTLRPCITCKREIDSGQKVCPACGASQNRFLYLYKYLVVVAIVFISVGLLAKHQLDIKIEHINQAHINSLEEKNSEHKAELTLLNARIEEYKQKLTDLNTKNIEEGVQAEQEKLKLDTLEKRATDAEGRASWLSKENRRFQNKIKELETELKRLNTELSSTKSSLENLLSKQETLEDTSQEEPDEESPL